MPDLNRATEVTPEITETINDVFEYHPWDSVQGGHGSEVRLALTHAFRVIIAHVPPCPDRSAALRKLREVRMDANSAITHKGKY